MLFSRSPPVPSEETVLFTSDNIIKPTHFNQFLGLYIDKKLDWQKHKKSFVLFFKQVSTNTHIPSLHTYI